LRKTVFLDRDGLINVKAPEHDYIKSPSDFKLLKKVPEAVKLLNDNGYLVLVVTNQRGIARGLMTVRDLERIHSYMSEELSKCGAHVDGIYVCPHNNGECTCRKPDIGLLLKAAADHPIDKASSWMIGDSDSDVLAGERFGVRTVKTEDLYSADLEILEKDKK